MKTAAALLALAVCGAVFPQGAGELHAGRQVYARSCANQNCHGAEGASAAAPALAGRGLTRDHVMKVTRDGIRDTAMPGWGEQLPLEELEAVVTFMMSLQKGAAPESQSNTPPKPRSKHPGRGLFFDAGRVGACGACHLVDGWGVPVAPPIAGTLPDSLEQITSDAIQTVHPPGEQPFPGLPVPTKDGPVRVYDLSAKLPILRTFPAGQVELTPGSSWTHRKAISIYNDQELALILNFLKEVLSR